MRLFVLTSCTGEKSVNHPDQLTLADFKKGAAHVTKREKTLADSLRPAGEIYTGEQHVRLLRGIAAVRAAGATVDLWILSAGYGIVPADRMIAPYEATFATMGVQELRSWADQLHVPDELRKLVSRSYDYGLVLLGDNYLQACAISPDLKFGGPTLLVAGKGPVAKLPRLSQVRTQVITNAEATRFSCGLVGLKGELAARLLPQLASDSSLLNRLTDPATDLLGLLDTATAPKTSTGKSRAPAASASKRQKAVANAEVDKVIQIPNSWWAKPHRKQMRYFIPEWDDLVDPNYDFENDTHSGGSSDWSNEAYAHQLYPEPNYDGILVSRAVAEKSKKKKERINALGVHRFLRVPREFPIMGDCGAFDYIMEDRPPYSTEDVLDYYTRLDFDYGVSVDHLIVSATEHQKKFRYELTIDNAEKFIKEHRKAKLPWTPIGAVQGWDAHSYAKAAEDYVKMGYKYIGLGGLVRTSTREIIQIMAEVQKVVPKGMEIHLFGVARLKAVKQLAALGATSVDSASALRQAWFGAKDNYWSLEGRHYRALRVPKSGKSFRAKKMVSEGRATAEFVAKTEQDCMAILRAFDRGDATADQVIEAFTKLDHLITPDRPTFMDQYRRTLDDAPWKGCSCALCQRYGVEVITFRGNDRNRRRGFHNTHVFYELFQRALAGKNLNLGDDAEEEGQLQMDISND